MSTELVITTKVQPKPTKAEIIDALAHLEVQRRNEKSKADAERKEKMCPLLEKEVLSLFKKLKPEPLIRLGSFYKEKPCGVELQFFFDDIIPGDLAARLKEYHDLPDRPRVHIFSDIRKEVYAAASGLTESTRVHRLLNDPESKKTLEKLLDSLSDEKLSQKP